MYSSCGVCCCTTNSTTVKLYIPRHLFLSHDYPEYHTYHHHPFPYSNPVPKTHNHPPTIHNHPNQTLLSCVLYLVTGFSLRLLLFLSQTLLWKPPWNPFASSLDVVDDPLCIMHPPTPIEQRRARDRYLYFNVQGRSNGNSVVEGCEFWGRTWRVKIIVFVIN